MPPTWGVANIDHRSDSRQFLSTSAKCFRRSCLEQFTYGHVQIRIWPDKPEERCVYADERRKSAENAGKVITFEQAKSIFT